MDRGKLYLVSTPIGNLGDFSPRARETLRSVDAIAAEDTRHTLRLLNHFEIKNRLISFHEHSDTRRAQELLDLLLEGKNLALVTDAGTPIVSDPGAVIVQMASEQGIDVVAVPGPCAAIAALCVSALPADKFVFEGFLPRDKTRKRALDRVMRQEYTVILYESPHHLSRTLQEMAALDASRRVAVCKEITKLYERVFRGTLKEALEAFDGDLKGEYVLVLEGMQPKEEDIGDEEIIGVLEQFLAEGMSKKNAVQSTAQALGINRNRVYRLSLTR